MKKRQFLVVTLTLLSIFSFALIDLCINLPAINYNYANIPFPLDIQNNITEMDNMPADNPTTNAGATLGRVLFYDRDLSLNHTISCASCHI